MHLLRRADLLHAAVVHHYQAVGERHRLGLVVRHHDRCDAAPLLQDADFARHLLAQRRIEIGQRLVEQQHAGVDRQRACECDTLLLAAGQLTRKTLCERLELHQPQHLGHARLRRIGCHAPHLQPERDIARDGQMRKQRVALEHDAHLAPMRRQRGDAGAVEPDVAG